MNENLLTIWFILALINLVLFIRIDWGVIQNLWTGQIWLVTMVCCLIPPIGWAAFAVIWYQYRSGNND